MSAMMDKMKYFGWANVCINARLLKRLLKTSLVAAFAASI